MLYQVDEAAHAALVNLWQQLCNVLKQLPESQLKREAAYLMRDMQEVLQQEFK